MECIAVTAKSDLFAAFKGDEMGLRDGNLEKTVERVAQVKLRWKVVPSASLIRTPQGTNVKVVCDGGIEYRIYGRGLFSFVRTTKTGGELVGRTSLHLKGLTSLVVVCDNMYTNLVHLIGMPRPEGKGLYAKVFLQ